MAPWGPVRTSRTDRTGNRGVRARGAGRACGTNGTGRAGHRGISTGRAGGTSRPLCAVRAVSTRRALRTRRTGCAVRTRRTLRTRGPPHPQRHPHPRGPGDPPDLPHRLRRQHPRGPEDPPDQPRLRRASGAGHRGISAGRASRPAARRPHRSRRPGPAGLPRQPHRQRRSRPPVPADLLRPGLLPLHPNQPGLPAQWDQSGPRDPQVRACQGHLRGGRRCEAPGRTSSSAEGTRCSWTTPQSGSSDQASCLGTAA